MAASGGPAREHLKPVLRLAHLAAEMPAYPATGNGDGIAADEQGAGKPVFLESCKPVLARPGVMISKHIRRFFEPQHRPGERHPILRGR